MYIRKMGRVLTLQEERNRALRKLDEVEYTPSNQEEHQNHKIIKNPPDRNFNLGGYRFYQVRAFPNATDACAPHNGAIYRVEDAEVGVNIPPFHYGCRCVVEGISTDNPNHDPWRAEQIVWLEVIYGGLTLREQAQRLIEFYRWTPKDRLPTELVDKLRAGSASGITPEELLEIYIANILLATSGIDNVQTRMREVFSRLEGPSPSQNVSVFGLEILMEIETLSLTSYRGVDDWNLTIGFGHAFRDDEQGRWQFVQLVESLGGEVSRRSDGHFEITRETAFLLLVHNLQEFQGALNTFIETHDIDLSQHQYDALLLFSFQRGTSVWTRRNNDTGELFYDFTRLLTSGEWTNEQIIYEMGRHDRSGPNHVEGIWRRRMAEALMFNEGTYQFYELDELREMGIAWPRR